MLAAADVYRPAAVDQLKKLADEAGVPVYCIVEDDGTVVQDAVRVAREALAEARKTARDILIIDTAGRLHVDERMMQEVEDIKKAVDPTEILFVVDSMTGQDAVNTAKEFNERLDFHGVVLTKLDGTAKGGMLIGLADEFGIPVKYVGVGVTVDDLRDFVADEFVEAIFEGAPS